MEKSVLAENYIFKKIRDGQWGKGDRLPPEPELCRELNVSLTTLRIALKTLANRNIIERRQRSGSYVTRDLRPNKVVILANFETISSPAVYLYRVLVDQLKERITANGYVAELAVATGVTLDEFAANLQFDRRNDLYEIYGVISMLAIHPATMTVLNKHQIPGIEITSTGYNPEFYLKSGNNIFSNLLGILDTGLELLRKNNIRDFTVFFPDVFRDLDYKSTKEFVIRRIKEKGFDIGEENTVMIPWSWDRHHAYEEFLEWWRRPNRPATVFFMEDVICKMALRAIWEKNIKIPDDIAILTHSNGEHFHAPLPLDVIQLNPREMADAAFDALQRLHHGENKIEPVLINPVYIPGKSLLKKTISNKKSGSGITVTESRIYREVPREYGLGCWKCTTGYRFIEGPELFEVYSDCAGHDRYDNYTQRFSGDNGLSWQMEREFFSRIIANNRVYRISELFQELDTNSNTVLRMYLGGTYENDQDEMAGLKAFIRNAHIYGCRSFNGAESFNEPEDITEIYHDLYSPEIMPFISCSHAVSCSDGLLRIPMYTEKPGGGGARLLTARPQGTQIKWGFSNIIPQPAIPGMRFTEGTLAELPDGRFVAIYRADAIAEGSVAWRKWISVSEDGGDTWLPAAELKYGNGRPVVSPCSQGRLICHSSGKLFFMGNILEEECDLYEGRNSLSIIEIDRDDLTAVGKTLTQIDFRKPDENRCLAISNFTVYEDRFTGDLHVFAPRAYSKEVRIDDCVLMKYTLKINPDRKI